MVVTLVISFFLHLGITFLLQFSYEKAEIWGSDVPNLHQPKLDELQEENLLDISSTDTDEEKVRKERVNNCIKRENNEKRQKYVDKIISPAYNYFRVKNEIDDYQNDRSDGCTAFCILQFPTIALMTYALFCLEFTESIILCIVIAIIPCLIGDWVISFIYARTKLPIEDFEDDLDLAKKQYEHSYNYYKEREMLEFNISKEDFINIEIIKEHNAYLQSIKQTVIMRYVLRKIISIVGTVVCFVCFLGVEEY